MFVTKWDAPEDGPVYHIPWLYDKTIVDGSKRGNKSIRSFLKSFLEFMQDDGGLQKLRKMID